jgi:hypothetical protein
MAQQRHSGQRFPASSKAGGGQSCVSAYGWGYVLMCDLKCTLAGWQEQQLRL